MLQFYSGIFIFGYYSQLCFAQSANGEQAGIKPMSTTAADQAAQKLIQQMTSPITLSGQTKSATMFYTGSGSNTRFLNAFHNTLSVDTMGAPPIMMPNNQVALSGGKQEKVYLYQMTLNSTGDPNKMVCLNHRSSQVGLSKEDSSVSTTATATDTAVYPIKVGLNVAGDVWVIGYIEEPMGWIQCLSENGMVTVPYIQDISVGCVEFNALSTKYVG